MDLNNKLVFRLAVLVLSLVVTVNASCQDYGLQGCDCEYPIANRYLIECENRGLSEMPPKVNKTLTDGFAMGNFSFNDIPSIPNIYFNYMRHFDILDFTSNKIKEISKATFRQLETKLTTLNMSKNSLSSIERDTFEDYRRLKILDLSDNALSSPCKIHTADVLHYSLAGNSITKLSDDCFPNSIKVISLNLARNRLSSIDSQAFAGLESLERLDLSKNQLSSIRRGFEALSRMMNFEWLSLEGNQFESLDKDTFCSFVFPQMKTLVFSHNSITSIEQYCFSAYESIPGDVPLELHFDHNKLSSLDVFMFAGLGKRLRKLWLNDNKISSVNVNTFKDQKALVYLNMDGNQLEDLEFLTSWDQNSLTELSVAQNAIRQLTPGVFNKMKSLVKLNLNGNLMTTIDSKAFTGLASLYDLSVDNNFITSLANQAFAGLDKLRRLKLSGNALVTMKNCTFAGLSNLLEFHFKDNLLLCDCDLSWLVEFINTVSTNGLEASITAPVLPDVCHYPDHSSESERYIQNEVLRHCDKNKYQPTNSCFGLHVDLEEPDSDGATNVTWSWDSSGAPGEVLVSQHDIETGALVFNDSARVERYRTLNGFKGDKMYKVCALSNSKYKNAICILKFMLSGVQ